MNQNFSKSKVLHKSTKLEHFQWGGGGKFWGYKLFFFWGGGIKNFGPLKRSGFQQLSHL